MLKAPRVLRGRTCETAKAVAGEQRVWRAGGASALLWGWGRLSSLDSVLWLLLVLLMLAQHQKFRFQFLDLQGLQNA